MSVDLANKVVVITGAGSGIGRALAAGFCADGARVVGFGRSPESLEETSREFGGGKIHCVAGDVAREADVARLLRETIERHGRIDVLVNCAAVYPKEAFLESSAADWAEVIETNVIGMALCCRAALPSMLQRNHGRIVNVGSFAWKSPIPLSSAYSVSKAAVHVLTRALAVEIGSDGSRDVLVNELLPGVVKTRMSETGMAPAEVYTHARFVATLPSNGPTGKTFLRSRMVIEDFGLRARMRRLAAKLSGGLLAAE